MRRVTIGCGRRNWPGWLHIDGNKSFTHLHGYDITLIDEPTDSIDLLYSSHLIAYLSPSDLAAILIIWHGRIAPGGTLRLATPDFDVLTKLYQTGTPFERIKGPLYGEMRMNGAAIYHKTCYDERTLSHILAEAGFVDIVRYDHRVTEHPNTGDRSDVFDDCSAAYFNGHLISLNLECKKKV